jgi:hypothetical protein
VRFSFNKTRGIVFKSDKNYAVYPKRTMEAHFGTGNSFFQKRSQVMTDLQDLVKSLPGEFAITYVELEFLDTILNLYKDP